MPEELDKIHSSISAKLKGKENPKTGKPYTEDEMWAMAQEMHKKSKEDHMSKKEESMSEKEDHMSDSEHKKMEKKKMMMGHKEFYLSNQKIEYKEEEGEFYSYGFVATTHPDRSAKGKYKGDILTKEAVSKIVTQINSRKGFMADLASAQHDWVRESNPYLAPVGRAVKAELREMPGGHYGAWVQTHHDKTYKEFDDAKYKVEHGYWPGYSIEYEAKSTSDLHSVEGTYRLINDLDIYGYGFASARNIANPAAVIEGFEYKEIEGVQLNTNSSHTIIDKKETGEVNTMSEEIKQTSSIPQLSEMELKEFKEFIALKAKEKSAAELQIQIKEALKEILPESKIHVKEQVPSVVASSLEFKEWAEIGTKNLGVKEAFNRATALAHKVGAFNRVSTGRNYEFKIGGQFNERIEVKALTTTTNQSTDTDYLQNAAELSDIYAPAVTLMLNQKTTFFGLLPKESWAGRERIQWRAENVANASASSYAEGGAITKGNTTRQKLADEFKYYKVGVQVTGQMMEASKSGVGDAFQVELEAASRALLSVMNVALFGTSGAAADLGFIGLEYIADSSTYTTLYGLTRSATNLLGASGSEISAQSSAPISKATLRTAIRTLEINGADRSSLLIVCHPLQRDLVLSLLDDAQRFASTVPRAGFEGMPTFDGIPIHADKDANNDDIFVVNLGQNGLALAVQKPVTYTELAITDDSRSGFLKFYGNMYAKAPKQSVYMIQGLATA